MRLLSIPLRNVFVVWWRSLTLGAFIFFIGFSMVFANSFILSIKDKIEDDISDAITGDIQIRSGSSTEDDMIGISGQWDASGFLQSDVTAAVKRVLDANGYAGSYAERVRVNGLVITDLKQYPAMAIGVPPEYAPLKRVFSLTSGDYMRPGVAGQALITRDIAKPAGAGPGTGLGILAQTRDGYMADAGVEVTGVGDAGMISMFSFPIIYVDLATARAVAGIENGEASEIIVKSKTRRNNADAEAKRLVEELNKAGVFTIFGAPAPEQKAAVRVTSFSSMGGFILGISGAMVATLYGFLAALMLVVSILIWNLVFMIGVERYRDIGTLKALGFSRGRIVGLFIAEILFITGLAGLSGMGAGSLFVMVLGKSGIPAPEPAFEYYMGKILYMKFDIEALLPTLLIILIFSTLASLYPAFRIASVRPAETMRE